MYYEIKLGFIILAYISKIVLNQHADKMYQEMNRYEITDQSVRVKRNAGSCE